MSVGVRGSRELVDKKTGKTIKKTVISHQLLTKEDGKAVEEGKWKTPLDATSSLAKNRSDRRFKQHDLIYLAAKWVQSNPHSIDDDGNWGDEKDKKTGKVTRPKLTILDKFNGRGGPSLGSGNFGEAYVVKITKQ